MVFFTCAAIICMIRPFRSPWVQRMCSAFLHPLFSLSLYWEFIVACSPWDV